MERSDSGNDSQGLERFLMPDACRLGDGLFREGSSCSCQ